MLLSKRDKEILSLKKDMETLSSTRAKGASEEETSRMKDYIKTLEAECKGKKESNEGIIERLKEFTCMTLRW